MVPSGSAFKTQITKKDVPRIKKYTFEGCIIFILSEMVRLLALKIIQVEKLSRRWRPGRIGYSRPDFITSLLKSYNFISLQSLNMNKYRIRKKPEGLISNIILFQKIYNFSDFQANFMPGIMGRTPSTWDEKLFALRGKVLMIADYASFDLSYELYSFLYSISPFTCNTTFSLDKTHLTPISQSRF